MKFEVNIDKKHFFILLGAILILAGAIYGYAQDNDIPNPGHSLGEIDVTTSYSCGAGEYLKSIDLAAGSVVCESDQVGGDGGSAGASIDYNDCSQIEFTTGDGDNWLAHTCPTDMVLVGGAGCGGSYCGGLRYARCCKLNSGSGSGGSAQMQSKSVIGCGIGGCLITFDFTPDFVNFDFYVDNGYNQRYVIPGTSLSQGEEIILQESGQINGIFSLNGAVLEMEISTGYGGELRASAYKN